MPVPEALYPGMASASVVSQLDFIYILLTIVTLLHAIKNRGLLSGTMVVVYLAVHTATFEHISLFLGGTHCHATSPNLPMVSPCSSINSVLFYVPWTYTSIEGARRLSLNSLSFPFLVGLLQLGFGAVYEMQGPWNGFWMWPDSNGVIATSNLLQPWNGYPPIQSLEAAKVGREVATILDGTFRVSHHAGGALSSRLFEFPLLAPYFHFAFGFGWAGGLLATGRVVSSSPPSLGHMFVAGVLSVALFLPPIWVTRGGSELIGLPLSFGVPLSLVLSIVPVIALGRGETEKGGPERPDLLLLSISCLMQAFFVSWTWRYPTPGGLQKLVCGCAAMHLMAQAFCCLYVSPEKKKKV
ncbi:hypothetical protein TrST_g4231 [Triparma strigata]|uniref:Uncharacterized protein n=1 Tax=Triparma strigata TaxID=1606541 RepID=A0A9W6ZGG0_9STRA|nr:hypothetical protein TrST_g4231 [Triparma strigata]